MASELHVDAIKHSGGTSAITINSSGNVSIPGSVVQVARTYVASSGHISTSSSSLVASGIQCSITPKFSNSLILVDFNTTMSHTNSGRKLFVSMYLKVGSASISAMSSANDYHVGYVQDTSYQPLIFGGSYTATSTDTLMFEPYFEDGNSSGSPVYLVHSSSSYSLTVTEIAQ